ncbi:LPD7 domain-containing protein [Acidithiobacillus sp.]
MDIVDTIKANTPAAREARKHAEMVAENRGFILTAASEDGEIRVPVASKGDLVSKLDEAATKWPGQVIVIDASETEVLRAAEYAANHDMLIQPKDIQNKKLIDAVAQQYGMIPEVYQELIAEPDHDIGSMGPVIDLSNEKIVSGHLLAVGETQRNGDLGVEVSVADADGKVSRAFVAYRNIDEANLNAVKKLPEVGGEILGSEVHFHMGDGNASIEPIGRQHSLSSAVDTSTEQTQQEPVIDPSANPAVPVDKSKIELPKEGAFYLLEHGASPYQVDDKQSDSYYARVIDHAGKEKVIWGVDLERALESAQANAGEYITLENQGKKSVRVQTKDDDGKEVWIDAERNSYEVSVLPKEQAVQEKAPTEDIAAEIGEIAKASELPPMDPFAQNTAPNRSAPEAPKYPRKSPPEILMTSRRGAPYVKDHGDQITVTRRATLAITRRGKDEREQAIATALMAARERFGEPVRIHGTPAFVNETIKQAVQQGIKLEPVGHHAEKEYARVLAGEQKLKDKVLQAGSMAPSKSKEVHKGQGLGIG